MMIYDLTSDAVFFPALLFIQVSRCGGLVCEKWRLAKAKRVRGWFIFNATRGETARQRSEPDPGVDSTYADLQWFLCGAFRRSLAEGVHQSSNMFTVAVSGAVTASTLEM